MARQLLLAMGAEGSQLPGTPQSGADTVRKWLNSKNLSFPELVIDNGAGLSRVERISAQHVGDLLLAAWESPVMPEVMASMPIAALDGTMKKRLNNQPVAGHAHIKTGNLEGVKSAAGYVLAKSGKRFALVCLINHPRATLGEEAIDALIRWAHEQN